MKVYIRSAASISAQKTFKQAGFLDEVIEYTGTRLPVIEPDFKAYIDPKLIRRMSHVIKRGVAAASECLKEAGVDMPGAIITGTAFGCMEDTITFLTRIVEGSEEMLPPTAFIQSTHNTVAAQIALMLKCHAYNNTFVHKGVSFEHALLDAIMLLNEQEADNILVGGTEEMVDTSFKVLTRLGLYKRWPVSNLALMQTISAGTIGGEGAAFFLLSDKADPANLAELCAMKILFEPENIGQSILALLKEHDIKPEDIDLLITGKNGDTRNDAVYQQLISAIFPEQTIAHYKHLCGEYPVANSFGLWLAANILKNGRVPEVLLERAAPNLKPKKILLYNHYQNKYHSLMLLDAV